MVIVIPEALEDFLEEVTLNWALEQNRVWFGHRVQKCLGDMAGAPVGVGPCGQEGIVGHDKEASFSQPSGDFETFSFLFCSLKIWSGL